MASQGRISEASQVAINHVASYELHISDAYLSMRPTIDNWATGVKALESALEMEKELTKLLQDLKNNAYEKSEKDLVRFLGKYLDKQKRNTSYLEHQIVYHKHEEKKAQQKEDPLKKPAEVSGKD
ncbi:hypothetical protein HJG60_010275 [Phyllostomus discolor]|uniref:Ferritin-like diiron domain-containing protein n=1 Tax=Phyllostomus discolor TaxID=89673 RepID=A0A834ASH7_9CHIR|nr:hypothetical protein HJG60_010275 [Phyllostomus discolor]